MSALAKLLERTKSQVAIPATPATPATRPDQSSRSSESSSSAVSDFEKAATRAKDPGAPAPIEWPKLQAAADRIERKREARRRKVLDMLSAAPETVRYAWHADDRADAHYVVVALAIRGVGTCELSIAKDRYDPGKLLEIIDGTAREVADRG